LVIGSISAVVAVVAAVAAVADEEALYPAAVGQPALPDVDVHPVD
jgi:hypothetical protein